MESTVARRWNRKALCWCVAILAFVGLACGVFWRFHWRQEHARAVWKTATLERLAGLTGADEGISRELDELKAPARTGEYPHWTGEHVLLMTNGEYIIYAFWHGSNRGFVDHLFLGHGSDGRWLYSTYHFCNSMVGANADPPGSIKEFEKTYWAHAFDGKSDECLNHTWPP